jgi:hypothetical protein
VQTAAALREKASDKKKIFAVRFKVIIPPMLEISAIDYPKQVLFQEKMGSK